MSLRGFYYPSFIDDKTGSQGLSNLESQLVMEPNPNLGLSDSAWVYGGHDRQPIQNWSPYLELGLL